MNALKQAMFFEKKENGIVQCLLCPHKCEVHPDNTGICDVRKNVAGVLYSLNYELVSSLGFDPIEKKPLYKFYPGGFILSVGSVGCNFSCPFCQNYSIAKAKLSQVETTTVASKELVAKAIRMRPQGNIGIAYTYNEPFVWYEFVYETAKLAREEGLVNVLVTNGFISQEPLKLLLPYIDAMNIDLKGYNKEFYKNIVKGNLEDVKATIEVSAKMCHVELTTLVIPGLNDSLEEMERMCKWISTISKDMPLHLSRFFPKYKMTDRPPTSLEVLTKLEAVAKKYLNNVFLGNI